MDDDGDDKDDSKRKSRNLSEKKRRDQFNMLVNELSSMVSSNSRKMDKSTVLKSTILFLKNHNEVAVRSRVHEIHENWKPSFLSNEEFTHLTLEALGGFIMVFSTSGRIVYASESITSLLGHMPCDLLNSTIFDLALENDRPNLFNLLRTSTSNLENIQEFNQENRFAFTCHLKRGALDFREEPSYEVIHFIGYFRYSNDTLDAGELVSNNYCITSSTPRLVFVATGRLQTPQLIREMSVIDSSKSEFTSRHSLEWKFLFLDHRAPPIIGYLPFEVLGTSGYDYYHFDDLEKVLICHEALMKKGEGTSCYYRFLTKGQQWIWLQTRFYITYHQWSSKPEFVVCTHRVVSYADVIKHLPKDQSDPANTSVQDQGSVQESKFYPDGILHNLHTSSRMSEGIAWSHSSQSSRHSTTGNMSQCESAASSRNTSHLTGRHSQNNTDIVNMESLSSRHTDVSRSSQRSRHRCNSAGHQSNDNKGLIVPHIIQNQLMVQRQLPVQQDLRIQSLPPQGVEYLEASYVAAVPLQPMIGGFPGHAVIPPVPAGPEVQEHLQKKHEELQQMIIYQQEELRRVSEQLVMARYGLLPPLINVSYNQQPPPNIIAPASCITAAASAMPLHASADVYSPTTQGPSQIVAQRNDHSSQVNIQDAPSYIPMQMSQQQAQLLFSSSTIESRPTDDEN